MPIPEFSLKVPADLAAESRRERERDNEELCHRQQERAERSEVRGALANALEQIDTLNAENERLRILRLIVEGDRECPQIGPLSWLKSMIDFCRAAGPEADCEDRDAFWQMVTEIEMFHKNAVAALAAADNQ